MSPEDEVLSLKVRSLYDSGVGVCGSDAESQFSKRVSSVMEEGKRISRVSRNSFIVGRSSHSGDEGETGGIAEENMDGPFAEQEEEELRIVDVLEGVNNTALEEEEKNKHLLAGGTEDWEDLNGGDVDRLVTLLLGFFQPPKYTSGD